MAISEMAQFSNVFHAIRMNLCSLEVQKEQQSFGQVKYKTRKTNSQNICINRLPENQKCF